MYDIKPELMGIYNFGVATSGGSGGSGGGGGTGPNVTITVPNAGLSTVGVVKTCNTSNGNVTSETVNVVPTQYYVQGEFARIDGFLDSAVQVVPISSYTEN